MMVTLPNDADAARLNLSDSEEADETARAQECSQVLTSAIGSEISRPSLRDVTVTARVYASTTRHAGLCCLASRPPAGSTTILQAHSCWSYAWHSHISDTMAAGTGWKLPFTKGVGHFRAGKYQEAIDCFSEVRVKTSCRPKHIDRLRGGINYWRR